MLPISLPIGRKKRVIKTTCRSVIADRYALFLHCFLREAKLLVVTSPSSDGSGVGRLPDLHRARRGHRGFLFVEMQAGVFSWQFEILDQRPGVGLEVASRLFVRNIEKTLSETRQRPTH